jgi:hypothetical protein
MLKYTTAAALAAFLFLGSAIGAAACGKFEAIVSSLSSHQTPLRVYGGKDMAAIVDVVGSLVSADINGASRAVIFALSTGIHVGLEVDGCTLEPILFAPPKKSQNSGRGQHGEIGA